ncbi:PstS family phosphate ABC transporter substrate-binding protein [Novosphingobium kunmingense]|uniref:PstS family phosphate ABC transporter substrate-binding protein n=1 Tax=Novosphingobium kunmingense TaxID=1211806 RepID=UPI0018E25751|nr:substrate-binding domain-containing protein [Novosphingobium kunmingense]
MTARSAALPPPPHGLPGVLRIGGTRALQPLLAIWIRAFAKVRPDIRVLSDLAGSDIAMAGLYTATCDLALIGRDATKPEIQAFEWIYRFRPQGVPIANGSAATPGMSPALAVMVHQSNPLQRIGIEPLGAVFGDKTPRIRTWGQLGLTGRWRDQAINLLAPEAESGTGRFFRSRLLGDSNRLAWERMTEFPVPPRPQGAEAAATRLMHAAVRRDPFALALGTAPGKSSAVRTVAVTDAAGRDVYPTPETIKAGAYPLGRLVNAYYAKLGDEPRIEPARAFLRFVLSAEGQALVNAPDAYLSLSSGQAAASRAAVG